MFYKQAVFLVSNKMTKKVVKKELTNKVVNDIITMTNKVVIMTDILVKRRCLYMPLGNHVKEFRAAKNLNQQELGSLVGASRQTISLIERGDYNPSITLALKIAGVFEKTVEEVFYLTEEE